jgi:hypothetical protein
MDKSGILFNKVANISVPRLLVLSRPNKEIKVSQTFKLDLIDKIIQFDQQLRLRRQEYHNDKIFKKQRLYHLLLRFLSLRKSRS